MASNTSNITEEVRKTVQQEISRVFSCLRGPSGLNFGSAGLSASSNKSNDTLTFKEFYAKREESRRGDFKPARKRLRPDKKSSKKATPKDVEVKVALAYRNDMIKRSRGKGLLEQHRAKEFTCQDDQYLRLKIRRQTVWKDTKFKFGRILDNLKMPLRVQFIGEPAVDQAIGLMQGFKGPQCFQKTVLDYILSGSLENIDPSIEEIPNSTVRESLSALSNVTDEEEFKNKATFDCDYRFDAGYNKPFVYLEDKKDFIKSIALHYVLLNSVTEVNQYMEGLKTCCMLGLVQAYPEKFRTVFEMAYVTPSKSPKRVNYFPHFPHYFLRPNKGQPRVTFGEFSKAMNTRNCEWLLRPAVRLSELAQCVNENIDIITNMDILRNIVKDIKKLSMQTLKPGTGTGHKDQVDYSSSLANGNLHRRPSMTARIEAPITKQVGVSERRLLTKRSKTHRRKLGSQAKPNEETTLPSPNSASSITQEVQDGTASGANLIVHGGETNEANETPSNPTPQNRAKGEVKKAWTAEDESNFLISSFVDDPQVIHSFHTCRSRRCISLRPTEMRRLATGAADRFQHQWIMDEKLSLSTATDVNWLIYVEGQGMFCLLCRKHGTSNPQNKSKKYSLDPAVRFKRAALEDHAQSQQHKAAVEAELLSRVSSFEVAIKEIQSSKDEVYYKTFLAMYWLAKEEMPNKKFTSLLSVLEQLGLDNIKYFQHRSAGSVREMFLLIGSVLKEQLTTNLSLANCFGILSDE
ncbi:predicted protein, partial [Nematostella vectensis]